MTTLDEALAQSEKVILTKWIFGLDATLQPATKDAGPAWTPVHLYTTSADATGGADVTGAPTTGQKIVIDDVLVGATTKMVLTFLEETSSTVMFVIPLSDSAPVQFTPRDGLKLPVADKKLRIDASVAGTVYVWVSYHSAV